MFLTNLSLLILLLCYSSLKSLFANSRYGIFIPLILTLQLLCCNKNKIYSLIYSVSKGLKHLYIIRLFSSWGGKYTTPSLLIFLLVIELPLLKMLLFTTTDNSLQFFSKDFGSWIGIYNLYPPESKYVL